MSMVYAQPFGDLQILGSRFLPLVASKAGSYQYIPSLFVGPICLTLAIWGFCDRQWIWSKLLFSGLVIFLLISLGEYTPVAPYLLKYFPSTSILRFPVKSMIFPIIFLTIAAARGMQALLGKRIGKPVRTVKAIFWLSSLLLGIGCLAVTSGVLPIFANSKILQSPLFADKAMATSIIWSSVIGILCSYLEYLFSREKISRPIVASLILLGLFINLFWVAFCNKQMTASKEFYEYHQILNDWIVEYERGGTEKGRLLALYNDPLYTPPDYKYQPKAIWTANFFAYSRQLLLCNTVLDCHQLETFGYEAAETNDFHDMIMNSNSFSQNKDNRLEDLSLLRVCQSTGTRWLASQITKQIKHKDYSLRTLNPAYFAIKREDKNMNLRLYEVKGPTPRFYFAETWQWTPSSDAVKESLTQSKILHFAPLSVPLIVSNSGKIMPPALNGLAPEIPRPPDKSPALPIGFDQELTVDRSDRSTTQASKNAISKLNTASQAPLPAPDNANATLLLEKPEHLSFSVVTKHPGFFILCDHFYPGWCAFVDSLEVPIYKANLEMRAVYLPAGAHLVEFDFRSESLSQGLFIAGGGLLFLSGYFILAIYPSLWKFIKSTAGQ
jgi:hypothetical protein